MLDHLRGDNRIEDYCFHNIYMQVKVVQCWETIVICMYVRKKRRNAGPRSLCRRLHFSCLHVFVLGHATTVAGGSTRAFGDRYQRLQSFGPGVERLEDFTVARGSCFARYQRPFHSTAAAAALRRSRSVWQLGTRNKKIRCILGANVTPSDCHCHCQIRKASLDSYLPIQITYLYLATQTRAQPTVKHELKARNRKIAEVIYTPAVPNVVLRTFCSQLNHGLISTWK